jgi:hypothetical protein
MTDKELKDLYVTACSGKGFEPSDGQFKLWKQTLGWCEQSDLAKALVEYFSTNTAFPMPAELKALSEQARRIRVTQAARKTVLVRWQCPDCKVTMCGWIPPEDRDPRACRGVAREGGRANCGAIMNEVYREGA